MRVCILKAIKCWNFVVVRCKSCGSEDAESFAANNESRFRSPKTGEEESKLMHGSIPKSTAYKSEWAIIIFHQWQIHRKVTGPVLEL